MGSYISNNNHEVKTLDECKTQSECADLFIEHCDINPIEYCSLALKKLKNLTENQKTELENIITSDMDNIFKWKRYCANLTLEQINYVGW